MTSNDTARKTVAHILGSVDRGGVEMRMLEVARALPIDGPLLTMVTLTGREGSLAEDYKVAGASIVPMQLWDLGFAWRFVKFLRINRIRVVHSHVHLASGLILALAAVGGARKRIANFSSDGSIRSDQSPLARAKYAIMRWLLNLFATDIVGITPSTLSVAWKKDWREDARCRVLLTGFDLEKFSPTGTDGLRIELGVGSDEPLIVHVGRADIPTKNRDGAIRFFGEFAKLNRHGTLVFVGRDGTDEGQIRANRQRWLSLTEELGVTERVYYAGERMDVPDILASADLLLFTSTLEGLPGVLVEARAAGTPVVSSDVAGAVFLAELVGNIHLLSLEKPASEWADAIADALLQRPTPASRQLAMSSLRHSDLDIDMAVRHYRELWEA
ncbi:glycosyltransferase [Pseudarthrobacter sp. AL07]|uniref:glycosyltransferase n=1 Tax=unclassified Pseudarthrobacter TaxID=2647000 RepID=UPI00249AE76C|nr:MULTISPECIES: glycosyltransferase [unclassified Pseudarthrobacter]MDI3195999.1 glycosyltransferase [Pseudarthrobacter sp. AL20]MDI3210060.1 glycosyltransferase [Pseudarthrobacter sp. AL07]